MEINNIEPSSWSESFSQGIYKNEKEAKKAKRIAGWMSLSAMIFLLFFFFLFIAKEFYFINENDVYHWLLDWEVQNLLSPAAIIVSVLFASYIALIQLLHKERRDRIEHSLLLSESSPDFIVASNSIKPILNHLKDTAKHYMNDSDFNRLSEKGEWGKILYRMTLLSNRAPSHLAKLAGTIMDDHAEDTYNAYRALNFFEKAAIAISEGHAEDVVVWKKFNVVALRVWLMAYPLVLAAWCRHARSEHLFGSNTLGYPYENYEAWLIYHCEREDRLKGLLKELNKIRNKVLDNEISCNKK
ncbi:hypothetical protein HXW73_16310 [Halomonas sp. SH5A2]|uniref:hypothetical protein n=1 Tax=Halomonas sp. SH5A2 TaxID=2749040 RepID=UPI00163E8B5F|nr:hypothetical protein [Halomonas sp. SH5A2]QNI04376.1 hypothetical protein HXW73_16310 [Halomonas sp. SH5A2]